MFKKKVLVKGAAASVRGCVLFTFITSLQGRSRDDKNSQRGAEVGHSHWIPDLNGKKLGTNWRTGTGIFDSHLLRFGTGPEWY